MELEGKKLDPEAVIRELERCEREIRVEEGRAPVHHARREPARHSMRWPRSSGGYGRPRSSPRTARRPSSSRWTSRSIRSPGARRRRRGPTAAPRSRRRCCSPRRARRDPAAEGVGHSPPQARPSFISERDKNLRYFRAVCENHKGVVYAESGRASRRRIGSHAPRSFASWLSARTARRRSSAASSRTSRATSRGSSSRSARATRRRTSTRRARSSTRPRCSRSARRRSRIWRTRT
jgi:hypothetical protein